MIRAWHIPGYLGNASVYNLTAPQSRIELDDLISSGRPSQLRSSQRSADCLGEIDNEVWSYGSFIFSITVPVVQVNQVPHVLRKWYGFEKRQERVERGMDSELG